MRGDFKVSIDSEFVFRNRVVFESKQEIDALNDRSGIVLRATVDFNKRDILPTTRDDCRHSPVSAVLPDS